MRSRQLEPQELGPGVVTPAATSARGAFAADLERYYRVTLGGDRSLAGRARVWLVNADLRCVAAFRFAQAARRTYTDNRVLGLVPMLLAALWRRRVATVHHVNIHRAAVIGPGFFLMHRNGLFLGPVRIGANCVLHHNVTIGQRVAGGDQRVPTLGDNVWVGPGATITGPVTIGDDVTVSAGAVVTRDVPSGCLVAGNPARVVHHDYDRRQGLSPATTEPDRVA